MSASRHLIVSLICGALIFAGQASAAKRTVDVHPALWRIDSSTNRVYVFGSFHILQKGGRWVTPALLSAMEKADVFVFEVPVNGKTLIADAQDFIDKRGYLPRGQTLRGLLSKQGLQTYHALLAELPLTLVEMDKLHP